MAQPSTIYKAGRLNYVWNYLGKTLKDFAAALSPYLSSGGATVDANGNTIATNSSDNLVTIPKGTFPVDFVQDIPEFSGMLIVNDHWDGYIETWIAGGGDTMLLGYTAGSAPTSTLSQSGTNGYEWANLDGLRGPFTFTVIKTRNEA